jgi:chromosome segregation ATPase
VLDEEVMRSLSAESQKLAALLERFEQAEWTEIEAHLGTAVQAAQKAMQALNDIDGTLYQQLDAAKADFKLATESLERVKQGKMPLSPNVETLMRELRDEGINPVAVCDVVRITKKEWQPAIEAYLASNLQALLVPEHEERRAFEVYRGLPESVRLRRQDRHGEPAAGRPAP